MANGMVGGGAPAPMSPLEAVMKRLGDAAARNGEAVDDVMHRLAPLSSQQDTGSGGANTAKDQAFGTSKLVQALNEVAEQFERQTVGLRLAVNKLEL